MGAAWSSYKIKRKEKSLSRKKLEKHLAEAEEYIGILQDQHRFIDEILRQQQSSPPVAVAEEVESKTARLEEEIRALKDKLYLEEIALIVTSQRCRVMEENLSLIQRDENTLQQETRRSRERLSELKMTADASLFAQFKKMYPLDKWTTYSLPDLYLTKL